MVLIGLNSFWEEDGWKCKGGSVSLLIDGKLVMSVAEDRISRHKYDGGYQTALKYVLTYNNLSIDDVNYFCLSFYGNHMVPNDMIIQYHLHDLHLEQTPEKLLIIPSHHLSHAFAGYFLSPFNEAIIMVADNEGSILYTENCNNEGAVGAYCERNSYYYAKGNVVVLLERDFEEPTEVAFGKCYNKFTEYIGLGDYHNGGKTMGLSSYGKIPLGLENVDLWRMDSHMHLRSNMRETFDAKRDINNFLTENDIQIPDQTDYSTDFGQNLAYYVQGQLNKWAAAKIKTLVERTGIKNVCISGGVAQNGVMNAYIEQELGCRVFVPPFPSDQGQSLGNIIWGWIKLKTLDCNSVVPKALFGDFKYLGSAFTNEEIENNLCMANMRKRYTVSYHDNISLVAAQLLSENKIIGWFQGKSEYGCRALGARSILASPQSAELRDRVNILKHRELFRPLAPTVMKEYANEFFVNADSLLSEYMLGVVTVNEQYRTTIAGVTHIDASARIQTITEQENKEFYHLIDEYRKITGIPLVMNTSFNMAGEPIVETPIDAINSFRNMGLDALVCGNYLIEKMEEN